MGKRGNQGWSTAGRAGNTRGWSTLGSVGAGRPKGDHPPRRTHSYRASDEEHDLIRRFVAITRTDVQAAEMILREWETFAAQNGIIEPKKKKEESKHGTDKLDTVFEH